ncbi:hypothetical protein EX30DRAFT_394501 [Ascodesmis nigricans]|uniref:DUF4396 domain-containing protein n=1 Tax=Ascodesmis nigricans TaxID=341454 RepID=A0A4S2N2H3_9PEZI|nr:hypothetical protein EX30DRAFT_394501 [Ascodesmis nigricans]
MIPIIRATCGIRPYSRTIINSQLHHPRSLLARVYTTANNTLNSPTSPSKQCSQQTPTCPSKLSPSLSPQPDSPPLPLLSRIFWRCRHTWKRASINTTRCLIGCTTGDFAALWYLQSFHPDLSMGLMMGIPMTAGITSSLLLETLLLRFGRDRMPLQAAVKTAAGMSMVSMLAMESVETAVDWKLTGGVVDVGDPVFWGAAVAAMAAGFVAPLPWNYYRLRRWGKGCH